MFKKIFMTLLIVCFIFTMPAFAYNPNSFHDEEVISVQGNRPKVDIEASEYTVRVEADAFVNGIAEKTVTIDNQGNVPCYLKLTLKDVPADLKVEATVDDDFLLKGEATNLNIVVELTDMQETEAFEFTIVVDASLRP